MAKNTIHILCPSGHRLKAEITPNGKLLQVRRDFQQCNLVHVFSGLGERVPRRGSGLVGVGSPVSIEHDLGAKRRRRSSCIRRHQRTKCDLTAPWRLLGIPTNAVLELYRLDDRRQTADVHVQLQLPDNSRYPGWFEPTVTLQEMLDWYRFQPER